jgi:hypothetical protein
MYCGEGEENKEEEKPAINWSLAATGLLVEVGGA